MDETTAFVARTQELERLDAMLARATAGSGQVGLIAGRAGTGKTALVSEFIQRAQDRHQELVVAVGVCDAQTGLVNPYLPFREALNLLMGDVDARLTQSLVTGENLQRISKIALKTVEILVDTGPDLIGFFVPGGNLLGKVATQLAKVGKASLQKTEAFKRLEQRLVRTEAAAPTDRSTIDQSQIYEQCSNVLCKLAEEQPLILVIDDLHWADSASVGLLFRLGRRLASSRILLLGAYRPDEVPTGGAEERNLLAKTLTEFKRYLGDIWVDLDAATDQHGREFIDAYLAQMPNRLDGTFRERLFHHTNGQPLFTVELIHELQQQGGLRQAEDGAWIAGEQLAWDTLPMRVEGVVEERVARLTPELREDLTVGSVEGERFTAEVVARVRSADVRNLVRQISGIAQSEHHLVQALGAQRVGGQRISAYAFTSSVIQTYLYNALDPVERSYLHEDVGMALETLYGDAAPAVAVQLARHFDQAELIDKALHYLRLAGDQAASGYAHTEAIHFYSRALELTPMQDLDGRYPLLLARERELSLLGSRAAQVEDLAELLKLAEQSGDLRRQAEAILRRAAYAVQVGKYQEALADAEDAVTLAVQAGDVALEARARHRCGSACWQMGIYAEARQHLAQALALVDDGANPLTEALVRYELGIVAYYEDDYPLAMEHLRVAGERFATLDDRQGEAQCLYLAGVILDNTGDPGAAMVKFAAVLPLVRQVGWRYAEARYLYQSGNNLVQLGIFDAAQQHLQNAVALSREIDDFDAVAKALDMRGVTATHQGRHAEARTYFDEALALQRAANSQRGQGFVLTHLGYLLIETEEWETAVDVLHQAWELRLASNARGLTIDTLAALALLALRLDNLASAGEYAEEILAWVENNGVAGIEYPVQVYLICYEVLVASAQTDAEKRARAVATLEAGHALLMQSADRMETALRTQFIEQVPYNRALHEHFLMTGDR